MPTPFIGKELHVDPSIAGDSGSGTLVDPYGDLEWCFEQDTHDTANGTRINVWDTAAETVAAQLGAAMTTGGWNPTLLAPIIIQGMTSTPGDGGIAQISGGGSVSVYNDETRDYVHFIDCEIENSGANPLIRMDDWCSLIRCEVHNSTATDDNIRMGAYGRIAHCHIHNHAGIVEMAAGASFIWNKVFDGANDPTIGIKVVGNIPSWIYRNLIRLGASGDGIAAECDGAHILSNCVWANGSNGDGIRSANARSPALIGNNILEGFSASGGNGINASINNGTIYHVFNNKWFNCNTGVAGPDTDDILLENAWGSSVESNTVLSSSPFTDAANGDFSLDDAQVKELHVPNAFLNG